MIKIAGRTFTWKMFGLTFVLFWVVWLTGAGLLAARQRVRVHPVNFPSGSALILVIPNPATKVTGHGGCLNENGTFVAEALSVENSRTAAAYATRNQCMTFPNANSAVLWAGWPPRFWRVTNVNY